MGLTTAADGVAIAYDVTGTGPVLVLVHGITESRRMWDPLIGDLAADHTVVAVDVRGHGESGLAPTYDSRAMADDVAAVLASRRGLATPLVVGHSMGGIVVTAFAAEHPCRGVVNVDQSIALGDFQDLVRGAEPMLRSDEFGERDRRVLRQHARARCRPRRSLGSAGCASPQQEVVLGVWAPLLELSRDELDALVAAMTADVQRPVPRPPRHRSRAGLRRLARTASSPRPPSRCGTATGTTRTSWSRPGSSTACAPSSPRWRDRPRAPPAVPARRGQRPGVDGDLRAARRRGRVRVAPRRRARGRAGRLREPLPVQRHRAHAAARGLRAARPARPAGLAGRPHRAAPARHRASSCSPSTTRCSWPSAAPPSTGSPAGACSSASGWAGCARRSRRSASIPTSAAAAPTRASTRCGSIWREDEPSFAGQHFAFGPVRSHPKPVQPTDPDPRRRPQPGRGPPRRRLGDGFFPLGPVRRRSSTRAGRRCRRLADRRRPRPGRRVAHPRAASSATTPPSPTPRRAAPSASSCPPAPPTSTSSVTPWTPPSPRPPPSDDDSLLFDPWRSRRRSAHRLRRCAAAARRQRSLCSIRVVRRRCCTRAGAGQMAMRMAAGRARAMPMRWMVAKRSCSTTRASRRCSPGRGRRGRRRR